MHRLVAAALLLASACATSGQLREAARASRSAPLKPVNRLSDVRRLPSGLWLAAFQVETQRDLVVRLTVQAGAAYQPAGKPGLAALSHVLLRRAPIGPAGATLEAQLVAAGAHLQVHEEADEVSLAVRCRPHQLAEVVGLLGRLVDGVEAELGETEVAEVRGHFGRLLAVAQAGRPVDPALIVSRALAGTRYDRPAPSAEALGALGLDDVRGYLQASFTPPRAALVVVGGAPPRELQAAARQALPPRVVGDPARPAAPSPVPPLEAPLDLSRRPHEVVTIPSGQPELWLAWPVPGAREETELLVRGAAQALRLALGATLRRADVLGTAVVERQWDAAGVILARVTLAPGADVDAVRAAASAGLGPALSAAADVDGAPLGAEGVYTLAALGYFEGEARCLRLTGRPDALAWTWSQSVAFPRDWHAYLRTWIAPGPAVSVLFRPEQATPPPALMAEALGALTPAELPRALPFGEVAPGPAEVGRLVAPPGLTAAHREPLPGGGELVVLARPGSSHVWGHLVLRDGWTVPHRGVRDRFDLEQAGLRAQRTQGCLGLAEARPGADGAVAAGLAPSVRLPLLLDSLSCWSRATTEARPRAAPVGALAFAATAEVAAATGQTAAEAAAPEPADAGQRFLARALAPARATLILVGDVEPGPALTAWVRDGFSAWAAAPAAPAAPPPAAACPAARRLLLVDAGGRKTSAAVILVRAPPTFRAGFARERLALTLLRARLVEPLLRVGAMAEVATEVVEGAAHLRVSLQAAPEQLPRAIGVVLGVLHQLGEAAPAATELNAVRWTVAREVAFAFDSPREALAGLTVLAVRGLPPDGLEHLAGDLAGTGPDELRGTFRSLALGREAIVVEGDAAALGPALEKAGLPVERWVLPGTP